LLLTFCAPSAHAAALRLDATFTGTLDSPAGFAAFEVPAQPLFDALTVGNADDLWVRFADGIFLDIGANWVMSSNLGSLIQFDADIPHLMVNEDYLPTDAAGSTVGGAGPYNNSIVGPASALFINAFGVGEAPPPSAPVFGVLLRNVFEGAAPLPTQTLAPTATFTISTAGAQAVTARRVPEPAGCLLAAALAAIGLPRFAQRVRRGRRHADSLASRIVSGVNRLAGKKVKERVPEPSGGVQSSLGFAGLTVFGWRRRVGHLLLAAVLAVAGPGVATAATISRAVSFRHEGTVPGLHLAAESSKFPRPYYEIVLLGGAGEQSARYSTTLRATFNPRLEAPGTTVIQFHSSLGPFEYEFNVGLSGEFGIRDPGIFVEEGVAATIDIEGLAASLPESKSDSDADTLGIPIIGFLGGIAGVTVGYTQEWFEEFTIDSIRATIVARHRGSGVIERPRPGRLETGTTFSRELVLQGGTIIPIDLDLPGIWDISLTDLRVHALIDREITHGAGVGVDYLVGSDDLIVIPIKTIDTPLIPMTMRPLIVESLLFRNWFAIEVVPEPASWPMTVGVLAHVSARRRRCG
jgi:hypothetical protein